MSRAYARAERRRTARRLLCRQLARVAGGWSLFGVVAPWMPLVTVLYGLGIIAAGALITMAVEWWASNALAGLLRAETGSR